MVAARFAYKGGMLTVRELSEISSHLGHKIPQSTLSQRLHRGWVAERAISEQPSGKPRPDHRYKQTYGIPIRFQ